jgi:hypothetical protein
MKDPDGQMRHLRSTIVSAKGYNDRDMRSECVPGGSAPQVTHSNK